MIWSTSWDNNQAERLRARKETLRSQYAKTNRQWSPWTSTSCHTCHHVYYQRHISGACSFARGKISIHSRRSKSRIKNQLPRIQIPRSINHGHILRFSKQTSDSNGLAWTIMQFLSILETDALNVDYRDLFYKRRCIIKNNCHITNYRPAELWTNACWGFCGLEIFFFWREATDLETLPHSGCSSRDVPYMQVWGLKPKRSSADFSRDDRRSNERWS